MSVTFKHFLGGVRTSKSAGVFPPVNIHDNGGSFMVRVEIPGVGKDSLDVSVRGRELRQFRLGQQIDQGRITAELKDGVLTLHLPKADDARARRIQVQAG